MINSFHEQGSPLTLFGRALGSIPPGNLIPAHSRIAGRPAEAAHGVDRAPKLQTIRAAKVARAFREVTAMFQHDYVVQLLVRDKQSEQRKRAPRRVRAPASERRWARPRRR